MEAALISETNGITSSFDSDNSVDRDDQTLVAAAQAGSQTAFEELVQRYEQRVFHVARTVAQDHEDAEEITQDAFVNAFRNLCQFRGDSRFYTWLIRITINAGLMKLRRRRLHVVSIDDPIEGEERVLTRELQDSRPTPEHHYFQAELHAALAQSIGQLQPIYRIVFELRDVEGFSTEQVARVLNISVPAVKSRLQRGRLQLQEALSRDFHLQRLPTKGA